MSSWVQQSCHAQNHCLAAGLSGLQLPSSFFSLFCKGPWALQSACGIDVRYVAEYSTVTYSPLFDQLCISTLTTTHYMQNNLLLWGLRTALTCGKRGMDLYGGLICPFIKITVGSLFLWPASSPTLGSRSPISWGTVDSWWLLGKADAVSFKGETPGGSPCCSWLAPRSELHGQQKLKSMSY